MRASVDMLVMRHAILWAGWMGGWTGRIKMQISSKVFHIFTNNLISSLRDDGAGREMYILLYSPWGRRWKRFSPVT